VCAAARPTPNHNPPAPRRFAYTFNSLTRAGTSNRQYQIPLPGSDTLSKNYAYSVSGVAGEGGSCCTSRHVSVLSCSH
jgi:hypothetical protein